MLFMLAKHQINDILDLLLFPLNILIVEIYQNTYELSQNSVIIMIYVAMTLLNPWLPQRLENI